MQHWSDKLSTLTKRWVKAFGIYVVPRANTTLKNDLPPQRSAKTGRVMTERRFVQHNAMIFREATETFLQEEDDMADPHVIHLLVTTCVLRSLARYRAGPIPHSFLKL
jgi:hypothetical protein